MYSTETFRLALQGVLAVATGTAPLCLADALDTRRRGPRMREGQFPWERHGGSPEFLEHSIRRVALRRRYPPQAKVACSPNPQDDAGPNSPGLQKPATGPAGSVGFGPSVTRVRR